MTRDSIQLLLRWKKKVSEHTETKAIHNKIVTKMIANEEN